MEDILIGSTIGSYKVQRLLGEGAFGRVYFAEHPDIGSKVAIKILNQAFSSDETVVHRFISEAKAVNKILHQNIIRIFDFGQLEDTRYYCIMEFIEGKELTKIMKERDSFSIGEVFGIVRQIVDGLDAAHQNSIIHRDLKPDNIIVSERDNQYNVKILDFGIAKLTESTEATSHKTKTGQVIGTPAYMSPEQARGEIEKTGPHTDIYSLGVIVYQMLSGELPIKGRSVSDLLVNLILEEPEPLKDKVKNLPPELSEVVLKCLRKNPEERYGSVKEFFTEFFEVIKNVDPEILAADLVREQQMQISSIRSSPGITSGRSSLQDHSSDIDISESATIESGALLTHSTMGGSRTKRATIGVIAGVVIGSVFALGLFFIIKNFVLKGDSVEKNKTVVADKKEIVEKTPEVMKVEVIKKVTPKSDLNPPKPPVPQSDSENVVINAPDMCFNMGFEGGEKGEKPLHKVCLAPYIIDRYEVTVEKYAKCVKSRVCTEPVEFQKNLEEAKFCNWKNEARKNHPVNCVTWSQANTYCAWASKRLPTEAEWEYAARGNEKLNLYPWGKTEADCKKAVIFSTAGEGCGKSSTWPVGSLKEGKSPFGVMDMSGNVWEWTSDFYDELYYSKVSKKILKDPSGPENWKNDEHTLRGGGWSTGSIRSTYRQGLSASKQFPHVGFRCSKYIPKNK
ncbi:MAG: SUMF1/EgtB/PvdO family nonheme iron enzyme [Deltaproteobacteria bacterium]|nr:SUMF1/EgtB/PvdO family nonheme iron enzyme [Deltaproteobacteria bacterium]